MPGKVVIDQEATGVPILTPQARADGTLTGGLVRLNGGDKAKGTAADERGTMDDLLKDKDHVIDMGGGSDIFVFSKNTAASDLNGIVKMGDGVDDNDAVYMAHQISDYAFTLRSDGGIKIEYIGAGETGKGDAVTFYGAENFVFRNINDETNDNFASTTLAHDALQDLIVANGG